MKIPAFDGLSDGSVKMVEDHNNHVDDVQQQISSVEQQLSDLHQQVSDRWPALVKRRDELRGALFSARQQQLAAVLHGDEILDKLTPELAELRDALGKALQKVVARVEKDLRKTGLAPEQTPLWALNPDTAEARFKHTVAQSEDVRQARGQVEQCDVDLQTVDRLKREGTQQAAALGEQLRKLAASWLGC